MALLHEYAPVEPGGTRANLPLHSGPLPPSATVVRAAEVATDWVSQNLDQGNRRCYLSTSKQAVAVTRRGEPVAARIDDTRDRILEAAFHLFAERGFSGTTTREIAERAGVNEVTVFRHFHTKEKLFQAGVEEHSPLSMLTGGHEGPFRDDDVRESLRRLASQYLEAALPQAKVIHLGMIEAGRNPELREIVAQAPQRLQQQLAGHLRSLQLQGRVETRDFDLLSHLFYGMLLQHVLGASGLPSCVAHPDIPAGLISDTIADLFWSYLRPAPQHVREDAAAPPETLRTEPPAPLPQHID